VKAFIVHGGNDSFMEILAGGVILKVERASLKRLKSGDFMMQQALH
jgi:hypothetical protein